jgi:hypothetical protein
MRVKCTVKGCGQKGHGAYAIADHVRTWARAPIRYASKREAKKIRAHREAMKHGGPFQWKKIPERHLS